jgi:beta-glucosidase
VNKNKEQIKLVFMGDSITEGMYVARDVLDKLWGKYYPEHLGIGGDSTQHLLWRIQNGEVSGLDPKLVVVLIGTNNLNDFSDEQTVEGVQEVVAELRKRLPESKVLVLGLLPRDYALNGVFRKRVHEVNYLLSKRIADGKHVFYFDVGKDLLLPDGSLPPTVMPDFLHPSHHGYELLFNGIKPTVDQLLQ